MRTDFEIETALQSLRLLGHATGALDAVHRGRLELGPDLVRSLGNRMLDLAEWLQGNPRIATALSADRLATLTRVELKR